VTCAADNPKLGLQSGGVEGGRSRAARNAPCRGVVQHTLARSSTEQENAGLSLAGRGGPDLAPGLRGSIQGCLCLGLTQERHCACAVWVSRFFRGWSRRRISTVLGGRDIQGPLPTGHEWG
jgi:hypothetical protein